MYPVLTDIVIKLLGDGVHQLIYPHYIEHHRKMLDNPSLEIYDSSHKESP